MDIKRGDIVVCAIGGDYGKPRPAVVIQSNLFNPTHASITVCPITSHLIDTPLFRLTIAPAKENGLKHTSQVMVDKVTTLKRDKITQCIGFLSQELLIELNKAIKLWTGFE